MSEENMGEFSHNPQEHNDPLPQGGNSESTSVPQVETEIDQTVLLNAVMNYNHIQEEIGRHENIISLDDQTLLGIDVIDDKSERAREVGIPLFVVATQPDPQSEITLKRYIKVGNYDPAQEKFLHYDELVSDEDFAKIEFAANAAKARRVEEGLDYDFDDPEIVALRKKHRAVLEENGFIGKVATERLGLQEEGDTYGEIRIDGGTSYYVSIRGYKHDDHPNIDIFFKGGYRLHNGVKDRDGSWWYIPAAIYSDKLERYIPNASLPSTGEKLDEIVALGEELVAKKKADPLFDPTFVAKENISGRTTDGTM